MLYSSCRCRVTLQLAKCNWEFNSQWSDQSQPRDNWSEITDLEMNSLERNLPTNYPYQILPNGTHPARTNNWWADFAQPLVFQTFNWGSVWQRHYYTRVTSYLSHNFCLHIPVCIHICSLSERSHSGKMQSEDRCSLCRRSAKRTGSCCICFMF